MLSDFFYDLGVTDALIWLAGQLGGAEWWMQILLLVLGGAIPGIESYNGSFFGTFFGVHPAMAIPSAVIGNLIATLGLVMLLSALRTAATRNRREKEKKDTWVRRRVLRAAERYGVPGACLLGPLTLPSQITAAVLVAIGAKRNQVLLWQAISILLWGVAFGLFGEVILRWIGPDISGA
ncbi:hypothetical protein [Bogoriella caseilytica]|uniref:Small multi-drug export protein n=1 Tax=Bogoriella caseilytica TaxID=56055 RepID=A0A3N2B9M1_9MICO|nr:hypothetical protein [Bogoriella caseilytica]ROR71960.1 hypothetical protein EDD31_0299 [Bogoriella caseilytica]